MSSHIPEVFIPSTTLHDALSFLETSLRTACYFIPASGDISSGAGQDEEGGLSFAAESLYTALSLLPILRVLLASQKQASQRRTDSKDTNSAHTSFQDNKADYIGLSPSQRFLRSQTSKYRSLLRALSLVNIMSRLLEMSSRRWACSATGLPRLSAAFQSQRRQRIQRRSVLIIETLKSVTSGRLLATRGLKYLLYRVFIKLSMFVESGYRPVPITLTAVDIFTSSTSLSDSEKAASSETYSLDSTSLPRKKFDIDGFLASRSLSSTDLVAAQNLLPALCPIEAAGEILFIISPLVFCQYRLEICLLPNLFSKAS